MKRAVIFDMYGVLLKRRLLINEREHPSMTALLRRIKDEGAELYLLSNIFVRNSKYFIQKYPFLSLFDKLYFSSDTGFVKPDPRAYKHVLKENNLEPQDCIFFDDTKRNVEAAEALGIEAHLFKTPEDAAKKLGLIV